MCALHCPRPQGYNDNSGLGPILARYLEDESKEGQILVLIMNALGDHQMEMYFNSNDESDGMMCEGEAILNDVFKTMNKTYQKSFQDIGGQYKARRENEKTCAIRLPSAVFFEVWIGLGQYSCWSGRRVASNACSNV